MIDPTLGDYHAIEATAKLDGDKIVITGAGPSLTPIIRGLPEARWNGHRSHWTCYGSPKACDDLKNAGVIVDTEIEKRAIAHDLQFDPPTVATIASLRWKTEPWEHQKRGIAWGINRHGGLLALRMGEGKSLTAITLASNWKAHTIVVLCPKSVIGVWRREMRKHYHGAVEVLCVEKGTSKKKANEISKFISPRTNVTRVVVINYESAWRPDVAAALLKNQWCVCILDESHRIKAPTGAASKFAYKLGKVSTRRLCLTGTPIPHSKLDLYAQLRFIDPAIFGTSFTTFRARFAQCNPMFPSKVDKWINEHEFNDAIAPYIFRVNERVLDLPPIMHERIEVELEKKTQAVYDAMQDDLIAQVETGEVTASNALVKVLRLQQITSGTVTTEDGVKTTIGHEKERALLDILEDIADRDAVAVFCRFTEDIECVRRVTEKLKRRFGEISGRRKDLTPDSMMPDDIDVIAVNEQSGGTGIDLTRARYMVWFSLSFSLGDFDQAIARLHRPGQDHPVMVYHLVAKNTIDERIYSALDKRRSVIESVFEALSLKELSCGN